jgi:hypothetical protein
MNLNIGNTQKIIGSWFGGKAELAYILATIYHETAATMLPIRERGGNDYFFRMYDPESPDPKRAALAKKMGALPGDGILFPGRGYIQITWRQNYLKFEKLLKQDFTSSMAAADRMLEHDNAIFAAIYGMERGIFTGKKLSDYITKDKVDFVGARRIINGTDKAQKIAAHANEYLKLLVVA